MIQSQYPRLDRAVRAVTVFFVRNISFFLRVIGVEVTFPVVARVKRKSFQLISVVSLSPIIKIL